MSPSVQKLRPAEHTGAERAVGRSGARRWLPVMAVLSVGLATWLAVRSDEAPRPSGPVASSRASSEGELVLLLTLAEDTWRRGDLDEAIDLLARSDASAASVRVRTRRAALALRLGEVALARTEVEGALRAAPDDVDALLLAAQLAGLRGDVAAVGSLLQRATAQAPRRPDVSFALARHHGAAGDLDAARTWIGQARRHAAGDADVALEAAKLLSELGDPGAAERLLVEAANDPVAGPVAAARLGVQCVHTDRWEEAERWFRRALVRAAPDAPAHAEQNEALVRATLARLIVRRDGALDEAAQHATRAAALSPDLPDVWKGLACLARARGDLDEAFSLYDDVARASPGDVEAREALSSLYRRWGANEAAIEQARRAISAGSTRPGPHVVLSRALRSAGDDAGAVAAARSALACQPDHAAARAALAAALSRDAAERLAFDWPLDAALDAEAVADLAEGLARSGELERARALLDDHLSGCVSAFGRAALVDARSALSAGQ